MSYESSLIRRPSSSPTRRQRRGRRPHGAPTSPTPRPPARLHEDADGHATASSTRTTARSLADGTHRYHFAVPVSELKAAWAQQTHGRGPGDPVPLRLGSSVTPPSRRCAPGRLLLRPRHLEPVIRCLLPEPTPAPSVIRPRCPRPRVGRADWSAGTATQTVRTQNGAALIDGATYRFDAADTCAPAGERAVRGSTTTLRVLRRVAG